MERIIDLRIGGIFVDGQIPQCVSKKAKEIVHAFEAQGITKKGDEVTVNLALDPTLPSGVFGKVAGVTHVFRDADGNIEGHSESYTVDVV